VRLVDGPSNRPLLDALVSGDVLGRGLVIVRRDGRVVPVDDARADDWEDLDAQLAEEPIGGNLCLRPCET
jgi:hypothetical protein